MNAALQEAVVYYRTLPTDDIFVKMSEYLKQHLLVNDPAVVRLGIKQIREHLGQQDLWEREVARIEDEMFRRCQSHSDIPICISIEEWAEGLTADARQYFEEECQMQFEIGMKVKRIPLLNEITEGAIIRYGVVSANKLAYVVNHNPFDEAHAHDYKLHRPKQEDFESAEAYASAIREYDANEITRQARILALAEMIFVSWRDRDGRQIAEGWMRPNQLREYTEDDAKADVAVTS